MLPIDVEVETLPDGVPAGEAVLVVATVMPVAEEVVVCANCGTLPSPSDGGIDCGPEVVPQYTWWVCIGSVTTDVAVWLWVPSAEPVNVELDDAECVWSTTIESAEPPVPPTEYVLPAATINLFRKSGVPLLPSQILQPEGIEAIAPDHIQITPAGIAPATTPATTFCTKLVVANCVVFVLFAAVGAAGVPVNVGEAEKTALPVPVVDVVPVPPLAVGRIPVTLACTLQYVVALVPVPPEVIGNAEAKVNELKCVVTSTTFVPLL